MTAKKEQTESIEVVLARRVLINNRLELLQARMKDMRIKHDKLQEVLSERIGKAQTRLLNFNKKRGLEPEIEEAEINTEINTETTPASIDLLGEDDQPEPSNEGE